MQQAKNKAGLFFSDPTEKQDQRSEVIGRELLFYNTDPFGDQPFIACLLCVTHAGTGVQP